MRRFLRDFSFVGILSFIITAIVIANRGEVGAVFGWAQGIPHFDKVGHFLLMGGLAFCALLALVPRMTGRASVKVVLGVAVVIAIEEGSQAFIASRTCSLLDYLASLAGVLVAWGVYGVLRWWWGGRVRVKDGVTR